MCGRSSLTKNEKELEARFQASFYSDDLLRYNPLPNYNVAPSHILPVITNTDKEHFKPLRWGLIPFWAKDMKIGYKMINARVETILEKKTFKNAVEKRRCIIPMDGFYEWKKNDDGSKTPYRIKLKDTEVFSVAGIWEQWKAPDQSTILSFSIITRAANAFMEPIHDRMPAILSPENERTWLMDDVPASDLIDQLLLPFPDEAMEAYPVSAAVGNVRNNDASLIERME